eukprot:SAG11_NODE_52_length_19809_cov_14.064231_15_plen_123_part_00
MLSLSSGSAMCAAVRRLLKGVVVSAAEFQRQLLAAKERSVVDGGVMALPPPVARAVCAAEAAVISSSLSRAATLKQLRLEYAQAVREHGKLPRAWGWKRWSLFAEPAPSRAQASGPLRRHSP